MDCGIGGLAGDMRRERCRVRLPWPVPASRIWRVGSMRLVSDVEVSSSGFGGSAWISSNEVIVEQ